MYIYISSFHLYIYIYKYIIYIKFHASCNHQVYYLYHVLKLVTDFVVWHINLINKSYYKISH